MCIRDRPHTLPIVYDIIYSSSSLTKEAINGEKWYMAFAEVQDENEFKSVSYTHLRAHETVLDLVCRLLLEKKKTQITYQVYQHTRHQTNYTLITRHIHSLVL